MCIYAYALVIEPAVPCATCNAAYHVNFSTVQNFVLNKLAYNTGYKVDMKSTIDA